MAEYVTKEHVIDWFRPYGHMDEPIPFETIVSDLRGMPAVDADPVRHGRWIEKDKYAFGTFYDCSICDNRILDNGHSWNYCPNCGARMDGKEVAHADDHD